MLLRVILENFLSFDEAVQFDMFPNSKRTTFTEHIYQQTIPVLKQAVVYGANGAGKSNLIKGVSFIRNFVLKKDFLSTIELYRFFFRLRPGENKKPLMLAIEFNIGDSYFIYMLEISQEWVEKEGLYRSGMGTQSPVAIFERKRNRIDFAKLPSEAVAIATEKMLKKNPLSSILALNEEFPIIEDDCARKAYSWFKEKLEVVRINGRIPALINVMQKNKRLLEFTNHLFTEIDLGISELKIKSEDFETWMTNHEQSLKNLPQKVLASLKPGEGLTQFEAERQVLSISIEDGIRKVSQFVFDQLGKEGFHGEMDIRSQSDGTVRLLTLIPALYNATRRDKTIFIDEINHCIHPFLIKSFVKYFANKKDSKGQLIFTTHETCLLDQKEIMRPDEVWFAEKKEGATQLYSLNDFKIHNSISIENGYLEGRYGAIPFIGTLE